MEVEIENDIPIPESARFRRLTARLTLTGYELGWLIGIIEADGCITAYNNGAQVRIVIKMTDRDTVARAAALMESNVLGPYENGPRRKPSYVTQLNGADAAVFLADYRHLFSARRQAKIADLT